MASDINDKYLQWLINELNVRNNYHHHKENMAWVVTALFVPGIIGLSHFVFGGYPEYRPWSIIFIVLMTICVALFVYKQFERRSDAADTIAVMINIVNKLCINDCYIQTLTQEKLEVEPYDANKPWPKFIQQEKTKAKGKGRAKRTKIFTDYVIYITIVLSLTISLIIALCKPLTP